MHSRAMSPATRQIRRILAGSSRVNPDASRPIDSKQTGTHFGSLRLHQPAAFFQL